MKQDGGVLFGQSPKAEWEDQVTVDRRNRVTLGINCLLVEMGDSRVLVQAGVGNKEPEQVRDAYALVPSRLLKGLRDLEMTSKDITHVILTNLQFSSAGGATKLDRTGRVVPNFPKAQYFVQRQAWDAALHPNERNKPFYHADDFLALEERKQVTLLDGDAEVTPGVNVRLTGGHARGHQIALIAHGGERVAFMGGMVPTPYHLDLNRISALDQFPEETLEQKRKLLDQAEREGWLLIFSQGHECKAGYIEKRNGKRMLKPVPLN